MRRVLMMSPHFPPDPSAGTHRVRLLAPRLKAHGWDPVVLTVDPRDYEGRLDPELAALVPGDVEVVRCRADCGSAAVLQLTVLGSIADQRGFMTTSTGPRTVRQTAREGPE